jgi:hypothetical protein
VRWLGDRKQVLQAADRGGKPEPRPWSASYGSPRLIRRRPSVLRANNPADSGRYDNLFVFARTLLCPIQQSKKMENDGGTAQVAAMDELRQSAVCRLSPSSSLPIGLPSGGGGYVVPSSASCIYLLLNIILMLLLCKSVFCAITCLLQLESMLDATVFALMVHIIS